MTYTDKQIESLISGIFDGRITEYAIPKSLYNAIADYLKRGVYDGFGANLSTVGAADLELLTELRTNIYMFSAAKSYTELKDMTSLLTDGEKLRSFSEFKKACREKYDLYNVDYAKTEYATAIGQAQMAVQWNEIERTKDIIPYLRYSAIGDACVICRPLDGIVAEVDDKIWSKIAPLNHFNCFCILVQERTGTPTTGRGQIVTDVEKKMQPLFVHNAGQTGEVFTKEHPYFDVSPKYKEYAKSNFGMPIPKTDT